MEGARFYHTLLDVGYRGPSLTPEPPDLAHAAFPPWPGFSRLVIAKSSLPATTTT
jgi:hypothetical protein